MLYVRYDKPRNQSQTEYSAYVSFPYDPYYVNKIKELPVRFWFPERKEWEIPTNIVYKLKEFEQEEEEHAWDSLPKKEASAKRKEKEKLFKNLEGIKEMRKVPNAIVVVDPTVEHNAVAEANKLHIPVFAICDTNCNPDPVDYVIPGNDDAVKSVTLIISTLSDAVVEAKGGLPEIAYTKDEGEEATMSDAIRQADRENALRLAARREMQRERLEKEKARRNAFIQKKNAEKDVVSEEADIADASENTPVEE